jgi:hypothetical protein
MTNAERQRLFVANQRKLNNVRKSYWLTIPQAKKVDDFVKMIKEKSK